MKIYAVFFFFFIIHFSASSQLVGGEVLTSGRKLAQPFDFKMQENSSGFITYRLAIDHTGKVSSAQILWDKSSKISTPLQVRARTYVLSMRFEPGTFYPEFHEAEVKINLVKPQPVN